MELATQIEQALAATRSGAEARRPSCVTLGTFDGVHLGHQSLLRQVAECATANGLRSVALVFKAPPRTVITPELRMPLLCTLDERIRLIRAQGIDDVVAVEFDHDVRQMSAQQFLAQLRDLLGMTCLMLGDGARIGRDQLSLPQLREATDGASELRLESVPIASAAGMVISSSGIRQALGSGDVVAAAQMLGRPFHRAGTVVRGRGRARELGVPTANISWSREIAMPAPGIYASWATFGDGYVEVWPSGTYVGDNPTFGGDSPAFETHLRGFDRDIYGEPISVSFVRYIRGDTEFASIDLLAEQIQRDIADIGAVLEGAEPLGYPIPSGADIPAVAT